MKRLALACLLSACAIADPAEDPDSAPELDVRLDWGWAWSSGPECLTPTGPELLAVKRGASLWASTEASVLPGTAGDHATVCLTDEDLGLDVDGQVTNRDSGSALIRLHRIPYLDNGQTPPLVPLMAHEILHLVIGGPDAHLAEGKAGILAAGISCGEPCAWSEDDLAHLAAFDLL